MDRMGEARLCVLCCTRPVDERWRPFCSERCRNEDLARWADGRYSVPGDAEPQPNSASLDSDASNDLDTD
jgi:endogenous inhibitor of DNA gyrase (YacG/DUF329 family)